MKTYHISKHYDGNYSTDIEADSEEEAEEKFNKEIEELEKNDTEFLDALGLQDGGIEIWEEEEEEAYTNINVIESEPGK